MRHLSKDETICIAFVRLIMKGGKFTSLSMSRLEESYESLKKSLMREPTVDELIRALSFPLVEFLEGHFRFRSTKLFKPIKPKRGYN